MRKRDLKNDVTQFIKKYLLWVSSIVVVIVFFLIGKKPTEIEILGLKFPLESNKVKLQLPSLKDKNKLITPTLSMSNNFSIKPKDIQNQVRSLPLLQQENAGDNYKGIKVNYQVFLSGTFRIDSNQYILMRHVENEPVSDMLIQCIIDLDKYPELKIINDNQQFNVKGTIKSVTASSIDLDECVLDF